MVQTKNGVKKVQTKNGVKGLGPIKSKGIWSNNWSQKMVSVEVLKEVEFL